jgi:hypothetical protein
MKLINHKTNYLYDFLNKKVLRFFLNKTKLGLRLSSRGKEFHNCGAQMEKAWLP